MSFSITLTTEDTTKLIDTVNMLDFLFHTLGENHTISIALNDDVTDNYIPQDIKELSAWYKSLIHVIKYSKHNVDLSSDEDYLNSLTA